MKVPVDLACSVADFRMVFVKHVNNLVDWIYFQSDIVASDNEYFLVKGVESILIAVVAGEALVVEHFAMKLNGGGEGNGFRSLHRVGSGVFHPFTIPFYLSETRV